MTTKLSIAQELTKYLETVQKTVADTLRPALTDDTSKRQADAVLLILGRVIQRLGPDGARVALKHLPEIDSLGQDFDQKSSTAMGSSSQSGPRAALEQAMDALQTKFSSQSGITNSQFLSEGGSEESDWFRRSCKAVLHLWDEIEDGIPATEKNNILEKPVNDSDETRQKLELYLRTLHPSLPEGLIKEFKLYYGGYVKQMAKLTLVENTIFPTTIVLRRDMAMAMTQTRTFDEFSIVKRVYDLGLPVPKPLLAEDDTSVLGGTFMLMEEIPNAEPAGSYFEKERAVEPVVIGPTFGLEVAKMMATLHKKTAVASPDLEKTKSNREQLLSQLSQMKIDWESMDKPPMSLSVDLALHILLERPLPLERPHCLVHADCGMHNFLVRDKKLAAVIDWELSHMGDPAEDLAMIRMMVAGDVIDWDDYVTAYLKHGGDPQACDPDAIAYYSILLFTQHTIGASRLRAPYFAGQSDNAVSASVLTYSLERLMQYQSKAINLAMELNT
ncbi:MAG: hypothetical protein COA43_00920 [Robiginitomaculum sp.]|nr:MAG: hypothetical protein COA43_00920 [Robiginitomaculum sp.]